MSTIDEVRKLLQDFIAPELRAVTAKIEAMTEVMAARFETVDEQFNTMEERFKRLEAKIDANHREVMNALNLDKRMAIIEDRQQRKQETQ